MGNTSMGDTATSYYLENISNNFNNKNVLISIFRDLIKALI